MTRRRLFPAVVLLCSFVLLRAVTPHAQALQRTMYVSVVNDAGAPVPDLGLSDFIVREDNLAREVLKVGPADTPMQVALLVDNSAASQGALRDIREGATEFVKGMTSGPVKHTVALVGVGERPTILVDYTADQAKLLKGAGSIFPQSNSGTYLMDGLIETSRGLKKREAARPVIVAIVTNGPEFSNRVRDQVVSALNDAGAAFHLIVLGPPASDLESREGRERAITFTSATAETGGRYENLLATSALPGRMKQVADELTHQYLVTYARPQSLIPPERITVSAKQSGLTARGTPVKDTKDGSRK